VIPPGSLPSWRSIMFVPVNVGRFVDKAHLRGADALLLDLEDSIVESEKDTARAMLDSAVRKVGRGGADVGVRVNRPLGMMVRDIEAAVQPGVSFLVLPKIEGAMHVQLISEFVGELEDKRGLTPGAVRLVVYVESATAFWRMEEVAKADPRLVGMGLGAEDFSLSCEIEPTAEALLMPKQMSILAARAGGILPIGFVGSIAEFADKAAFRAMIRRSRALGFCCASVIHPAQVEILNEEFAPTAAEIAHARALLDVAEKELASNAGSFSFQGKMIDKPIIERARRLLDRAKAKAARPSAANETKT
jgi:citrate lyase subunit beta/citryl-CoA lyase